MEPGYINAANIDLLLITASAYLRSPHSEHSARGPCRSAAWISETKKVGLNAVALAGYRVPTGKPTAYYSVLFSAASLKRLYAHDD